MAKALIPENCKWYPDSLPFTSSLNYHQATHLHFVLVSAKSLQLCLTLHDHIDSTPPGSFVHRILQARILEWVAMPQGSNLGLLCFLHRQAGFFTTSAGDHHPLLPSQPDLPPCPSPPSVFSHSNRIQMAVRGALKLKTHFSRLSISMSWFRRVL